MSAGDFTTRITEVMDLRGKEGEVRVMRERGSG